MESKNTNNGGGIGFFGLLQVAFIVMKAAGDPLELDCCVFAGNSLCDYCNHYLCSSRLLARQ